MRQEAEVTRSSAVLELKAAWVDLNLATMTYPALEDAFESVISAGWNSADNRAQATVESFYRVLSHNWSNAYYQYQIGTLEQSQWEPHLAEMTYNARDDVFQQFWFQWMFLYDELFAKLMNELIAEGE